MVRVERETSKLCHLYSFINTSKNRYISVEISHPIWYFSVPPQPIFGKNTKFCDAAKHFHWLYNHVKKLIYFFWFVQKLSDGWRRGFFCSLWSKQRWTQNRALRYSLCKLSYHQWTLSLCFHTMYSVISKTLAMLVVIECPNWKVSW